MSTDEERRARGLDVYSHLFGTAPEHVPAAMAERVGAVFAEEAFLGYGGPGWHSPGLSPRDRSIAVLAAMVSQGVRADRLSGHLQMAVDNGLDEDALSALMILLALYAGVARASLAMETVHDLFTSGPRTTKA